MSHGTSQPPPSTNECKKETLAYILIENPSKSNNLGPILRCAAAFAIQQVIFIGYDKCSVQGSHGSSKHVNIISFPTYKPAIEFLKCECNVVSIVGILGDVCDFKGSNDKVNGQRIVEEDETLQIVKAGSHRNQQDINIKMHQNDLNPSSYPSSFPIHKRKFPLHGNVCFSISKKSFGLPIHQAKYCDTFVHIETSVPTPPIISTSASASSSENINEPIYGLLDAQTCLSISLHHYNAFAGYQERQFNGHKFHVNKISKGIITENDREEKKQQRLNKRLQLQQEAEDAMVESINLFS